MIFQNVFTISKTSSVSCLRLVWWRPGSSLTMWCCRNPFSQWQRSFLFPLAKILATASCHSSNTGLSQCYIRCITIRSSKVYVDERLLFNSTIALKFGTCLCSTAAELCAKFQSDMKVLTTNLIGLRLSEMWRWTILLDIKMGPWRSAWLDHQQDRISTDISIDPILISMA